VFPHIATLTHARGGECLRPSSPVPTTSGFKRTCWS
jgi:hypothetical protein